MKGEITVTTTKAVVVAVVLTVLAASVGAGVAIVTLGVNPIAPGSGTLVGPDDLSIESQELQYTGNDVTGVNVTINNTGTSSHTVDIHVALENTSTGTVVVEETASSVSLSAGSTETTQIQFSNTVSVSEFNRVEVNVEQTG